MKHFLKSATLALALLVGLALSPPAEAQNFGNAKAAYNATTTTTALIADLTAPGATSVLIHVFSASTSTRVVTFSQGLNTTNYYPSVVITNPTSDGELWACPATPHAKFSIANSGAGTITALFAYRSLPSDPYSGGCKPFAAAAGSLGAYTFTSVTDSGLTATRIPIVGSGGLLADSSALTAVAGAVTGTSFAGTLIGGQKDAIAAKATDGAIASAPGTIVITKGSALGSSTLATPTTTTHDGYVLRIVSSTAFAHVVSVASGKVNGGTLTTITFTSAAIGDSVTLVAYQGVWYTISSRGTITIT